MLFNNATFNQATAAALEDYVWARPAYQLVLAVITLLTGLASLCSNTTMYRLNQLHFSRAKHETKQSDTHMKPNTPTNATTQTPPQPAAIPNALLQAVAQRVLDPRAPVQINAEAEAEGAGTVVQDNSTPSNQPSSAAIQYNQKLILRGGAVGQKNGF